VPQCESNIYFNSQNSSIDEGFDHLLQGHEKAARLHRKVVLFIGSIDGTAFTEGDL